MIGTTVEIQYGLAQEKSMKEDYYKNYCGVIEKTFDAADSIASFNRVLRLIKAEAMVKQLHKDNLILDALLQYAEAKLKKMHDDIDKQRGNG